MSGRKRKAISLEDNFEIISKRAKGEKSKDLKVEFGLTANTIAKFAHPLYMVNGYNEQNRVSRGLRYNQFHL